MIASLKFPVLGYTEIRLIEKRNIRWLAELVGTDIHIEVHEDDFVPEPMNDEEVTKDKMEQAT